MRVAVVGHTEWLDLAVVDHVPAAGEIVTAIEHLELPAGGGAVAAVQLRKLAGAAAFFCAIGVDERGERTVAELCDRHGVEVHAARRADREQRRAFTHADAHAERTITVLGPRLVAGGGDPLPWDELAGVDGVYFTGGDAGAARAARRARVLVASARVPEPLAEAGVVPDVVIASANDAKEVASVAALACAPRWTVLTMGARGGRWAGRDGTRGTWPVAPLPGPPVDAYGAGDSFAAGLTYGLAAGRSLDEALALAARCGAHCLAGRGPYAGQLVGPV